MKVSLKQTPMIESFIPQQSSVETFNKLILMPRKCKREMPSPYEATFFSKCSTISCAK